MNNQCINFRQRTKKIDKKRKIYFYCAKQRKEITFDDCRGCIYKEYKTQQYNINKNKTQSKNKISLKQKSNKLAKLERERYSLFTNDLEHCIICGKTPVNKHEIFGGSANRQKSMIYGLVIPLCTCEHHDQVNCRGIHFDKKLREEWHIKGQTKFNEVYPDLNFKDIFKKNYL